MAVEAPHLNAFAPQLLCNRDMINGLEGNGSFYGNIPSGFGLPAPMTENLLPMFNCSSAVTDSVPVKASAVKAESGLTYSVPVSRKRSIDEICHPVISFPANQNANGRCVPFTFLGEDISFQIYNQQFETDRFISQHMEKVRMEIEEKRKRNSRRIIATVHDGIAKRLKAKEEEIEKIGRLNWALEEKVKSLCVENQIWRDLAQTNEATANALRVNLEQVLAQVQAEDLHRNGAASAEQDDAESCCGSNNCNVAAGDEVERRTLGAAVEDSRDCCGKGGCSGSGTLGTTSGCRKCRNCGKEEACVLLLPCRHLCLCTVCGSSLHTCPVCGLAKNASVHVNMSS